MRNFFLNPTRYFLARIQSSFAQATVLVLCMLFFGTQASAQCDNSSSPTTYNGGAGPGDAFGQSFLIDNSCFIGNTLSSFSFLHNGNASANLKVEIFKGQSLNPADRIYVQENNIIPPGNFNKVSTIEFGTGTGTLAVDAGEEYTILLTAIWGLIGVRYSDNQVPGQGYASNNGGFLAGNDMRFSIAGNDCNSTNFYDNLSAPTTYNGGAGIGDAFGQSFLIDKTCFIGNTLSAFSFLHNGNASVNLRVEIFEGQSIDPADRIYVQDNNVLGPGNFNTVSTIELGTGTGSLTVEDGKVYTILLSPIWGLIGVRFSDNQVPGQGYASNNGGFLPGNDMRFSISGGDCNSIDFYDNLSAPTTYNGGAGIGDAFGQSFLIDKTCFVGNAITSFSFLHNGNASANLRVEIFEGQSIDPADRIYVQDNNVIPPGNFNKVSTIALGSGTGTLAVDDGKVYTILLSPIWGLIGVRFSDNEVPGQGYASNNGGFLAGNDMRFSIAGGNPCVATDNTPPVITLNGDNPQKVCLGDAYTEAGASATDACEINDPVVVSGTVDVHTVGNYTITYTATDAAGNTASVSRTVKVAGAPALVQDNCPNNNPSCGFIRILECPYQFAPDLEAEAMANAAYATGASLNWYAFNGANNPPGAQLPGPPAIDMENPASSTNTWVTQTLDGCESDPTRMLVRVKQDKDPGLTLDFTGISLPTCGGATVDFLDAVSGFSNNVVGFRFYQGKPNQGGTLLQSTTGATVADVNDPYFFAPLANGTNDYYVQSIMRNANQCGGEASDEVSLSVGNPEIISIQISDIGTGSIEAVYNSFPTNHPALTSSYRYDFDFTTSNTTFIIPRLSFGGSFFTFGSVVNNQYNIRSGSVIQLQFIPYNGSCSGTPVLLGIYPPGTNPLREEQNTYLLSASPLNKKDVALNLTVDLNLGMDFETIQVQKEIAPDSFEVIQTQPFSRNGTYRFIDHNGMSELSRYRVWLITAEGMWLQSETVEVRGDALVAPNEFSVFPNPTTDRVQIQALFPMEESLNWQLTDMVGKTVMQGSMHETEMSLDVSRLPEGVYQFVTTSRAGARTVNRIVKQ